MNSFKEEKNENELVDSKITDIKEEEKTEKSPFDSEETLTVDHEENNENTPADGNKSKTIRTIVIVALLLLPIVYIFYKTSGNSNATPEQAAAAANQPIDVAAYESVAAANPTFSNLLNLSNAYINSGAAGKAIEPLNKAIALNPESAIAYSNLGFAYTIIQQYKKGIEFGEKAVQLDSSFLLAKNNLNWAKDEQKKLLDAVETMEKTSIDKRDNSFYLAYGLLYLKLENYDKSIEIWNKTLVTEPNNSAALINIGVAYMSKLQFDNAIKHFQKAIEFNPADQFAKNNLAWALDEKIKAEGLAQEKKADVQPKK